MTHLVVDGAHYRGRALDLRATQLTPAAVVAAIRDGRDGGDPAADATASRVGETVPGVTVTCPTPGPAHRHVGHVHAALSLDGRAALAAAARSRGLSAPQHPQLETARAELDDCPLPPVDLDALRKRVAETDETERRLHERVASLRGRVQALRDLDADGLAAAEADLASAIERLTEVETARIAAEQRLEQAEREARQARDARERRLRLEDRVVNLERDARAWLVDAVADEFTAAVRALPWTDSAAADVESLARDDPVTAALAVARVAALEAPVVLTVDRFESVTAAAARLDAPVVRL